MTAPGSDPLTKTDAAQAPPSPPLAFVKEREWRRVLPALALFLAVPAIAPMRAMVPIEQTLLLLLPSLAICAWMAWRLGGGLLFPVAWTAASVWILTGPVAGGASYVAFARAWALVLSAAFGAMCLLRPAIGFFSRAMGSIVIAGATLMVGLTFVGVKPQKLELMIDGELSDRVESSVAALRSSTSTPEWQDLEKQNPEGARFWNEMREGGEAQLRELAPVATSLFAAMLAFESLAALGLAWCLHHRLSGTRIGAPLTPLREFRFEDQYVWGVILGLVLVLVTRFAALKSVGWSLLLFFGVLYALRGLGVMMWFLVFPGRWLGVAMIAIMTVIWPLWSFPLGIGLGDTYFDWRRRVRPSNQGSSQ